MENNLEKATDVEAATTRDNRRMNLYFIIVTALLLADIITTSFSLHTARVSNNVLHRATDTDDNISGPMAFRAVCKATTTATKTAYFPVPGVTRTIYLHNNSTAETTQSTMIVASAVSRERFSNQESGKAKERGQVVGEDEAGLQIHDEDWARLVFGIVFEGVHG
jgi:hypothetical protein